MVGMAARGIRCFVLLGLLFVSNGGASQRSMKRTASSFSRASFLARRSLVNRDGERSSHGISTRVTAFVPYCRLLRSVSLRPSLLSLPVGAARYRTTTVSGSVQKDDGFASAGNEKETSIKEETSSSSPLSVAPLPVAKVVDDEDVEEITMQWVRRVVVGLNLCPFAERPLQTQKLACRVLRGSDDDLTAKHVLFEAHRRVDVPGTSLMVCPECHPDDFLQYLDLLHAIEDAIAEAGLEGAIQVAPFHPLFRFEGSKVDDPGDWTNRSPFPMFHILREGEVTQAAQRALDGDAGKVWMRNVDLLEELHEELGPETFESVMKGAEEMKPDVQEVVRDSLGRFPVELGGGRAARSSSDKASTPVSHVGAVSPKQMTNE